MKSRSLSTLGLVLGLALGLAWSPFPAMAQLARPSPPIASIGKEIPLPSARDGSDATESWIKMGPSRMLRNVTRPTLTPVLPDPAKATGAAVIVAPGGAFMMLSMENEGWAVARWLADHGVAAFVLKYRLDPTPKDDKAFLSAMADRMRGVGRGPEPVAAIAPHRSTEDGLAAIRLVRSRASGWRVDPNRVGVVGFSAGAMLALRLSLSANQGDRPNFAAPIYPPMGAVNVPADAPPLFVVLASDDPLFARQGFGLIDSWQKARRPIEFHLFERGGHGFGLGAGNRTDGLWPDTFLAWMKMRGLLSGRR